MQNAACLYKLCIFTIESLRMNRFPRKNGDMYDL